MLLHNEQMQPLDVAALKLRLHQLDDVNVPEQDELETDLGTYYDKALTTNAAINNYAVSYDSANFATIQNLFRANGLGLFERIRRAVCAGINALSSIDDIIDVTLKAVASLIPGGIIVEWIVKKLIKFFLNKGYDWLCPVPAQS